MSGPLPQHLAVACELHASGIRVYATRSTPPSVQLHDADGDELTIIETHLYDPPRFAVAGEAPYLRGEWYSHIGDVQVFGTCSVAVALAHGATLPPDPPEVSPSGLASGGSDGLHNGGGQ